MIAPPRCSTRQKARTDDGPVEPACAYDLLLDVLVVVDALYAFLRTIGAVFGVGFFREYYTANSRRRRLYVRTHEARHAIRRVSETDQEERPRRMLVRRSHFVGIIAAWLITVPTAAGLAALIFFGLEWLR